MLARRAPENGFIQSFCSKGSFSSGGHLKMFGDIFLLS